MHDADVQHRPFTLKLWDLKGATSALRLRLSRLRRRRIAIKPVSEHWRHQHARDSVKR
ncbi:MAG: hypothetical protein HY657_15515 [Acidobacteria bacterium]|nr:hypothetical protein [Acidobacteriota bacterium]